MASPQFEVALFSSDEAGAVRMVGRSTEQGLVDLVRERLAAQRRRELSELQSPVRLVPTPEERS